MAHCTMYIVGKMQISRRKVQNRDESHIHYTCVYYSYNCRDYYVLHEMMGNDK